METEYKLSSKTPTKRQNTQMNTQHTGVASLIEAPLRAGLIHPDALGIRRVGQT